MIGPAREGAGCRRQTSVTAGTVMHGSHLPLRTWFMAAHIVVRHSNGIPAYQLQAQVGIGIGSYKAAWLLLHKLRRAMADPDRGLLQEPGPATGDRRCRRDRDAVPAQGRPHRAPCGRTGFFEEDQDAWGCRKTVILGASGWHRFSTGVPSRTFALTNAVSHCSLRGQRCAI